MCLFIQYKISEKNFIGDKASKKERVAIIREKLKNASREKNLTVCFDLGFTNSQKEFSKLAQQLSRAYGANKKAWAIPTILVFI